MSAKKSQKTLKSGKHQKSGKHEEPLDQGSAGSASTGPSKARLLLKVVTGGLAVFRALKRVRHTTGRADKLLAADAVAGLLPMITAVAVVVRQLRRKPHSAHATP